MRAIRTTLTAVMPEADAPNPLNPIHSNDTARDHGYRAALVGGATVYGWCAAAILDSLGRDWLAHGWADVAFRRPVFPNDRLEVRIETDGSLAVIGDDGKTRIDGKVGMGRADWLDTLTVPTDREPQPPADPLPRLTPESIPLGRALRAMRVSLSRSDAEAFCRSKQHETLDLFYGERAFVHPAWLASQPIYWLHHSFEYGPAIHTTSRIQHLAAAHVDDEFVISGACIDGFERNGHHYIVNDTAIDDRSGVTVARIRHTAIYEPRRSRQAKAG